MDYAPETCADLSFSGVAVGAERCRVHDLEPIRCVAFEGTNTGRRFHMCCVQDVSVLVDFVYNYCKFELTQFSLVNGSSVKVLKCRRVSRLLY
jgi:hypothetical protein